jgi:hypothetical protein
LRCGRSSGTRESYHEGAAVEGDWIITRVADQATRDEAQHSHADAAEPKVRGSIARPGRESDPHRIARLRAREARVRLSFLF